MQVDGDPLEVYATDEMRAKSMGYIESVDDKYLELCVSDQRKELPEDSWIVQFRTHESLCVVVISQLSERADGLHRLWTFGEDCSEPSVLYGSEPTDQRRFRMVEGDCDAEVRPSELPFCRGAPLIYCCTQSQSVRRFRFFKLPVSPDAEPHALPASTLGCIDVGYYRTVYTRHALPAFNETEAMPTIREDEVKLGIACIVVLASAYSVRAGLVLTSVLSQHRGAAHALHPRL